MAPPAGPLAGQVAVVTGAAGGLGVAYVEALRAAGAVVIGCDVRPGADVVADVSAAPVVRGLVDDVVRAHGRLDVSVANAGLAARTSPLDDWDRAVADFEELIGANLRSAYLLGRAVVPIMVEQRSGCIVNIATDHMLPPPGRPPGGGRHLDLYDAAKWGVFGLTDAWARALAGTGVRVNDLCMGAVDTPMLRAFVGGAAAEMATEWMDPRDIARLLVDLVAEGPAGRTGAHIPIWTGHPVELPPRE